LDLRGWRKLHNEELLSLFLLFSPCIIRITKSRRPGWAVHTARLEAMRNAYKRLFRIPEGKKLLGRSNCGWDLREIGRGDMNWIHMTLNSVH
jgi:hypothetical protein